MSNLLSQASLVMIPSGYKEDVVYSQIPTSGNGDLSFTRASNGTRINSAGLVEVCPWNLAIYSEDFSNVDWVKVGSTISSNVLVAPNGTTTADKLVEDTSNGVHITLQINGNRNVSSIYSFSVYAKAGERTKINLFNNGNGAGEANFDLVNGTATLIAGAFATIENVGNGWYRCNVGMQENSTIGSFNYHIRLLDASGNASYTGNGTSGAYIWGAQINLGTLKPYFPTTDRLNVPRLTYQNGGGGCPSLLLEKQSTNLALYSEQFDNAAWSKNQATIVANDAISPDGTQNAELFYPTSSGSYRQVSQNISVTNGITYSFSIFVKLAGLTNKYFHIYDVNNDFGAYFNIDNGTVANTQNGTATIENIGNGWYRCILISTATSTNTHPKGFIVTNSSANNSDSVTANGTNGFYIWGAQLEASSYPTSYIPTTSSSATRVTDACFKTGISSLIGQTSGTILWDLQVDQLLSSENILNIDNAGGFGQTIYFLKNSSGGITIEVYVSSVAQCSFTYSLPSVGRYKIALAYASNDFAFYVNGVSRGTASSGSVPATSRLQMGQGALGSSDGKVNELVLFTTRLTNAELASITTI